MIGVQGQLLQYKSVVFGIWYLVFLLNIKHL